MAEVHAIEIAAARHEDWMKNRFERQIAEETLDRQMMRDRIRKQTTEESLDRQADRDRIKRDDDLRMTALTQQPMLLHMQLQASTAAVQAAAHHSIAATPFAFPPHAAARPPIQPSSTKHLSTDYASVVSSVAYPNASVVSSVAYPNASVVSSMADPNASVVSSMAYPNASVVSSMADPILKMTSNVSAATNELESVDAEIAALKRKMGILIDNDE